jgi:hemin uptake protein HemP
MPTPPRSPENPSSSTGPRRVDLKDILGAAREVIIRHGSEEYRLRLTSNDKLLLTK